MKLSDSDAGEKGDLLGREKDSERKRSSVFYETSNWQRRRKKTACEEEKKEDGD